MSVETDSNRGRISLENASDLWINSPEVSSHFDACDSVIYHDPIKKANGYVSGKNDTPPVVAQKKSVLKSVDKFSLQSTKVTLPEDVIYAVANKAKIPPPLIKIEGEVMSMHDDDALYGVANKSPKISQKNYLENELIDDGYYGTVNKTAKTQHHNGSQSDHFENELQTVDYNDNVISKRYDDLPNDDGWQKNNSLTRVGGAPVIVSNKGNYPPESDISRTTKTTRDHVISEAQLVKSLESESSGSKERNRYALQYRGSLPITEQELLPKMCTQVVGQCIIKVAQQTDQNPAVGLTYEWEKGTNMILEISETKQTFELLDCDSGMIYHDHYLHSIRMWAVGKDANSKYFAYIIRNESKKHVCRVFLCDVAAQCIVDTIRNVCQRLATENRKAGHVTQKSTVSSVSVSSAQTEKSMSSSSKKVTKQSSAVPTTEVPRCMEPTIITCSYMGLVPASSSSGKETINAVTKKVVENITQDKWKTVSIELSPTSINIKDISNSSRNSMSLPVESITYVGSSTKNKNLAAILTRESSDKCNARVFFCERSAKELVQKIQAVCQSSAPESQLKNGEAESKKQKRIGRLFQGKQKAK